MVTVTLIAYKLCKSNPLPVMSITEVEEGRPTSRTVKPSSSPEKEATGSSYFNYIDHWNKRKQWQWPNHDFNTELSTM